MGWEDSTIAVMKDELRRLGMPVSGSHAELVKRLDALDEDVEVASPTPEGEVQQRASESTAEAVDRLRTVLEGLLEALGNTDDGPTEQFPTSHPEAPMNIREDIRDAARQLLTAQPDGRTRALRVLGEYGGSVSTVGDNDLERCLIALQNELKEVA